MTLRAGLVLGVATVLLLIPESLLRTGLPDWLAQFWFGVHYPAVALGWQRLNAAFPATGLIVLTVILAVIVLIPATVWLLTRRFLPGLLTLALCGAATSAWFNINWGFNYARAEITEHVQEFESPTQQDVEAFTRHLASVVAQEQHAATDVQGAIAAATAELNALLDEFGYGTAVTSQALTLRPGLLMKFGVAGSIQPFSLTAYVDGGLTDFESVSVTVHELAHVAGEASEAGATLLAALAGLRSTHPYARYSTALSVLASLGREGDYLLPQRAVLDLAAAREQSSKHASPALRSAQRALFGAFLDWQSGGDGDIGYSAGTELLIIAWQAGLLD